MDPLSVIVTALATGGAAAFKDTTEAVIKDLYAGLKTLIARKYASFNVAELEKKPESEIKRASTAEDLKEAGAEYDTELLEKARALITALRQYDPGAATAIGIDLEDVEAQDFRAGKVDSEGTGIRVRRGMFSGNIEIGEVRAGRAGDPQDP